MAEPDSVVLAVLDEVAAALIAAGYADPFTTTPSVRLRCVWAGDRLQVAGARPDRATKPVQPHELAGVLVTGLVAVMVLEHDPAADPVALAEAGDALRAALRELV